MCELENFVNSRLNVIEFQNRTTPRMQNHINKTLYSVLAKDGRDQFAKGAQNQCVTLGATGRTL
jgi:hypothetical protein